MKKNGFTLVELLAVVIILSAIMVLLMNNSILLFGQSKESLNEMQLNNLKESINMYAQDQSIKNCNTSCSGSDYLFDECVEGDAEDCSDSTTVKTDVKTLIEEGYFQDDGHLCGPDTDIITIHKINDTYSYDLGNIRCVNK